MSGRRSKALRREGIVKRRITAVRLKLPSDRWTRGLAAAGLMTGALSPLTAWALPQDGVVSAGSATISTPTATKMQIDQFTDRAVLDWRSFNIAGNEWVNFSQPSAASIALNRVAGQEPSAIYGSLTANGQIFLLNPSGILFGSSSRVDVGALTASTLNITNQDFLNSNYRFSQMAGYANAAVVNQGIITAGPGGYVALLGAAIRNEGVVVANLGSIAMAAGKAATLDMRGDGLIEFVVTDAVSGVVSGPNGESLASYVSNTGTLQADGGMVTLHASAVTDVIKSVVNQEGVIRAQSMEERDGVVVLSGGDEGIVSVSGTIDASGTGAGQTGGTVSVLGEKVGLFDHANINVSGDAGGGTVLVGGDYQGKNPDVQNAFRTYVSSDSTINADAITDGNGGKVIVWADDTTRYYGTITARGGAQGGDGGFVEVSGKINLDFNGYVSTSAPHGTQGLLLLDPDDLTISNQANGAGTNDAAVSDGTFAFTDAPATASVSAGALEALAAGTSISLQATNSITIADLTAAGKGGTDNELTLDQTGSVEFRTGAGGFSMNAGDKINITGGASLRIDAIAATSGGTGDGAVSVGPLEVAGGTGAITLRGTTVTLNGNITTANGNVNLNDVTANPVVLAAATTVSAGAGNVNFNGTVNGGFALTVNTTGATTFGNVVGGTTALTSLTTNTGGTTTLTGSVTTTGTQTYNDAVILAAATTLDSTGNSTINLASTVNGGFALAVNTTGATTFGNAVGGTTALASVTTNAGGTTTISGGLVRTTGAQTYNDAVAAGVATTFTSTGGGTLTLTNAANDFTAAVSLNTSGSASIVDANALDLGASTIGGNLSATATTSNITNSGALVITGTSTFTASAAGANITVNNASNAFTGTVTFAGAGGLANVTVVDTTAFDIIGLTLTGNLTVTSGGAITDSGVINVATLTTSSVGGTTLDNANTVTTFTGTNTTGGNISLTNTAGTLTLTGVNNSAAGGGVAITNAGNIQFAGGPAVQTAGGTVGITATGNTIFHGAGGLPLDVNANGGAITLTATTVGAFGFDVLTSQPVTCVATTCFINGTSGSQTSTLVSILSGIQAALTTEQSGPSELLTSGVLPENIFKSLGSQVLEIVGGAEGFGEVGGEGGELPGVKIIEEEIGIIEKGLEQFTPTTEQGVAEIEFVRGLIDALKNVLDTLKELFGVEEEEEKKK